MIFIMWDKLYLHVLFIISIIGENLDLAEFKGDASQIPSGSSVIVKRVPRETVSSAV